MGSRPLRSWSRLLLGAVTMGAAPGGVAQLGLRPRAYLDHPGRQASIRRGPGFPAPLVPFRSLTEKHVGTRDRVARAGMTNRLTLNDSALDAHRRELYRRQRKAPSRAVQGGSSDSRRSR